MRGQTKGRLARLSIFCIYSRSIRWLNALASHPGCLPSLFGLEVTGEAIRDALARDEVFRDDNASSLADLLGIANILTAYRYLLEEGSDEDVVGWSEFVHLGPSPNDEILPNWSAEPFNVALNLTGQGGNPLSPSSRKKTEDVQDLLPGDRIKIIDGTFNGSTGLVVSREEAMAMWEKMGGQKPGPIDPAGGVWVRISVFDRLIIVLLDRSQIAACRDAG
jgi:transcription antitermination factor NusG